MEFPRAKTKMHGNSLITSLMIQQVYLGKGTSYSEIITADAGFNPSALAFSFITPGVLVL